MPHLQNILCFISIIPLWLKISTVIYITTKKFYKMSEFLTLYPANRKMYILTLAVIRRWLL